VCISRALGAGGEEVARLVAGELGYRYVDDEIIITAADAAGVSPETIEDAEHTRPLIARIMEALGSAPAMGESGIAVLPPAYPAPSYAPLIESVIREKAKEGNVVIFAHGASISLANVEGVLRVLVTASPEIRAERVAAQGGLDARAATKAVEESDRERQRYLQRFYHVVHELPTHYDLTVNTDSFTVARAAQLIAQAART
jgi:cytidylate kinase